MGEPVRVGQVRRWVDEAGALTIEIIDVGHLCRYRYPAGPAGMWCVSRDYIERHTTLVATPPE